MFDAPRPFEPMDPSTGRPTAPESLPFPSATGTDYMDPSKVITPTRDDPPRTIRTGPATPPANPLSPVTAASAPSPASLIGPDGKVILPKKLRDKIAAVHPSKRKELEDKIRHAANRHPSVNQYRAMGFTDSEALMLKKMNDARQSALPLSGQQRQLPSPTVPGGSLGGIASNIMRDAARRSAAARSRPRERGPGYEPLITPFSGQQYNTTTDEEGRYPA